MSDETYFGPGTTPDPVRRAIERAKQDRDRDRPPVSTERREAFFRRIAEERKRAEGGR